MAIADTEGDSFREDIPETFENRCDGCFSIFMHSNLGFTFVFFDKAIETWFCGVQQGGHDCCRSKL